VVLCWVSTGFVWDKEWDIGLTSDPSQVTKVKSGKRVGFGGLDWSCWGREDKRWVGQRSTHGLARERGEQRE
jgi:hypothetical protein